MERPEAAPKTNAEPIATATTTVAKIRFRRLPGRPIFAHVLIRLLLRNSFWGRSKRLRPSSQFFEVLRRPELDLGSPSMG
jgi:hypothetical protein